MAALAHDSGKSQHLDGMMRLGMGGIFYAVPAVEQTQNFSGQRGKSAQVHLIVTKNSYQRLCGSTAKVIEIHLRDKRRMDVIEAGPIEPASFAAQDVTLQILEAHGAESQTPQLPRRMQQIGMHKWRESVDGTR